MFHPESNPLAPKSSVPKKPEKALVEIWLGKEAAALMEDKKPEAGDEDLDISPIQTLTEKEKRTLWEMKRPDEVTLRNIPKWKELPDRQTFKKDFKFQYIWKAYRKGLPLSDFKPHPKETLPSFQAGEALPHAKVFDITDTIAKAGEKDPKHPDHLTTTEVLEAIDEAGYRSATIGELAAYGRDYWKPDANPKTLTKAERELQDAQAPYIIGLNSVFSDANGLQYIPYLGWNGDRRSLLAFDLGQVWCARDRFLVLRKVSPLLTLYVTSLKGFPEEIKLAS